MLYMKTYEKSHIKTMKLKYQFQRGMKNNLNGLMGNILYQIFKTILIIL